MRPSLRRKLLFTDSKNSLTCYSMKKAGSIKPEKMFLLIDSRLNLQLLKVNSMSLKELMMMLSKLRMRMTLKMLDLDKWDLIWITIPLRQQEINKMPTKQSQTMKTPSKESTKPRTKLSKLRTWRDNKSLMLLHSETISLTKLRNKREMKLSMILKDSWWFNDQILKMPREKLISGRMRDSLLLS